MLEPFPVDFPSLHPRKKGLLSEILQSQHRKVILHPGLIGIQSNMPGGM